MSRTAGCLFWLAALALPAAVAAQPSTGAATRPVNLPALGITVSLPTTVDWRVRTQGTADVLSTPQFAVSLCRSNDRDDCARPWHSLRVNGPDPRLPYTPRATNPAFTAGIVGDAESGLVALWLREGYVLATVVVYEPAHGMETLRTALEAIWASATTRWGARELVHAPPLPNVEVPTTRPTDFTLEVERTDERVVRIHPTQRIRLPDGTVLAWELQEWSTVRQFTPTTPRYDGYLFLKAHDCAHGRFTESFVAVQFLGAQVVTSRRDERFAYWRGADQHWSDANAAVHEAVCATEPHPASVCVLESGAMHDVPAIVDPSIAPADPSLSAAPEYRYRYFVERDGRRVPFTEAYPEPANALGRSWYASREPLRLELGIYEASGPPSMFTPDVVRGQVAEHDGVPISAPIELSAPFAVVSVPLGYGCEYQSYALRTALVPRDRAPMEIALDTTRRFAVTGAAGERVSIRLRAQGFTPTIRVTPPGSTTPGPAKRGREGRDLVLPFTFPSAGDATFELEVPATLAEGARYSVEVDALPARPSR